MAGKRIVLTADRSLMTNYRGNFLYGFIACGPYEVLPEWVFDKVFCPPVETDPITGESKVAQVGLRRVESALLQGYKRDEVFIANPEMLEKSIGPDTKVVGINVMDPLGMAPVTTTMSPEKLSYVAMKFKKMCANIIQLKKKYDFSIRKDTFKVILICFIIGISACTITFTIDYPYAYYPLGLILVFSIFFSYIEINKRVAINSYFLKLKNKFKRNE